MNIFAEQPARKLFVFDRGWRIERHIFTYQLEYARNSRNWWHDRGVDVEEWAWMRRIYIKYIARLFHIGCLLAGLLLYVPIVELALLLACIQILFLLIGSGLVLLVILSLRAYDICHHRLLGITPYCPHCYKKVTVPIYLCPTCRTEHTYLQPSIYGVWSHHCKTCDTRLPTRNYTGRRGLKSLCPSCHQDLYPSIGEERNIAIAVIGNMGSGKTTAIAMAIQGIQQEASRDKQVHITFLDDTQESLFYKLAAQIQKKEKLAKQTETLPYAYTINIQTRQILHPRTLSLYDPPGSVFTSSTYMKQQGYYAYANGFIFFIDPFLLAPYRTRRQVRREEEISPDSNELTIIQTYERMVQAIETETGIHSKGSYKQPLAVIVPKIDALNLSAVIGPPAVEALNKTNLHVRTEGDAINELVRAFLINHQLDNLVRDLESTFRHVRYFSCTTLTGYETKEFHYNLNDALTWMIH